MNPIDVVKSCLQNQVPFGDCLPIIWASLPWSFGWWLLAIVVGGLLLGGLEKLLGEAGIGHVLGTAFFGVLVLTGGAALGALWSWGAWLQLAVGAAVWLGLLGVFVGMLWAGWRTHRVPEPDRRGWTIQGPPRDER